MSQHLGPSARVATKFPTVRRFLHRNVGLLAVLGVVLALSGPAANANDGDPVILGSFNLASSTTGVETTGGNGLWGITLSVDSADAGVAGTSLGPVDGGSGVSGYSESGNGVFGESSSSTASAVYGQNAVGGYGVAGRATNSGVAVLADNADGTGTALRTTGRLEFLNRSGIATIASGHKSVKVSLAGVTASSMVMATVQQTGGFYVRAAVAAAGSFTIYISKAPTAPATVKVAYLVLN